MTPSEMKKEARQIEGRRSGEGYYEKKYSELSVADLLIVLEDNNFHTEETLVEALVAMDYYAIVEVCKIIIEHDKLGHLPEELYNRIRAIDKRLREAN